MRSPPPKASADAETVERGLRSIAKAILPPSALPNSDAAGGHVDSLTEAVMGVTAGLVQIAEAISDLASAVRDRSND